MMTDEERARAFDFDHSGPFGNEKRIERLAAAFRAIREEVMQEAEALYLKNARQMKAEVRDEAAKVAENYPQNGDNLLIYLTAKDIARKLRTHGTPGEGDDTEQKT